MRILRGSPTWLHERLPVLAFEYDPTLWRHVGDDARSIFPFLMQLGYASLLFYDNQGDYLVSAAATDSGTIDDLHYWVADEARRRYFDVVAFAHRDQPLFESFRAAGRPRLRERHSAGPA